AVANPDNFSVTLYWPGGNWSAANRPLTSVTRLRVRFVSTLRISTVTPGRTAPLLSVTVPSIAAVVICAAAGAAIASHTIAAAILLRKPIVNLLFVVGESCRFLRRETSLNISPSRRWRVWSAAGG